MVIKCKTYADEKTLYVDPKYICAVKFEEEYTQLHMVSGAKFAIRHNDNLMEELYGSALEEYYGI